MVESKHSKFPLWLKRRMSANPGYLETERILSELGQQTICTNANCPNKGLCWEAGTAAVLILGNICTRDCKFCSVGHGKPEYIDKEEPDRICEMVRQLKLKYLVITSVTRDDLADGGAQHFCDVIEKCRKDNKQLEFELLVPDFKNCQEQAISILGKSLPFVFGHNIETVPRLYSEVRSGADYQKSLELLKRFKQSYGEVQTKSSIMLGLGEREDEIVKCLEDLRGAGCDRIAIGQYLKPDKTSVDVVEFIEPEKFEWWAAKAKELGFTWVMSSPFTRSSYHAEVKF
ncbi:MAG: lipoyl synthase [Planctomycetes bacterium]|nr:lipoyl synthase [Planctomycetota bacterium]